MTNPKPIYLLGIDPSLRNTGLILTMWDGKSDKTNLINTTLISTSPSKDYRKRHGTMRDDLRRVGELIDYLDTFLSEAPPYILTGELPSGSQSHSGAKSSIASLALLHIASVHYKCNSSNIYTPTELKIALTDNPTAAKGEMIDRALEQCVGLSESQLITKKGKVILTKAEHIADAYASTHKYIRDNS